MACRHLTNVSRGRLQRDVQAGDDDDGDDVDRHRDARPAVDPELPRQQDERHGQQHPAEPERGVEQRVFPGVGTAALQPLDLVGHRRREGGGQRGAKQDGAIPRQENRIQSLSRAFGRCQSAGDEFRDEVPADRTVMYRDGRRGPGIGRMDPGGLRCGPRPEMRSRPAKSTARCTSAAPAKYRPLRGRSAAHAGVKSLATSVSRLRVSEAATCADVRARDACTRLLYLSDSRGPATRSGRTSPRRDSVRRSAGTSAERAACAIPLPRDRFDHL